jgi:hypothetical protein
MTGARSFLFADSHPLDDGLDIIHSLRETEFVERVTAGGAQEARYGWRFLWHE